eukprot:3122-Heterococcus_DN1.PRE.2
MADCTCALAVPCVLLRMCSTQHQECYKSACKYADLRALGASFLGSTRLATSQYTFLDSITGLGADFPGSRVAAVVLAQIPYQLVKLRAKLKEQDNAGKGRRPKALKAVTVKTGAKALLLARPLLLHLQQPCLVLACTTSMLLQKHQARTSYTITIDATAASCSGIAAATAAGGLSSAATNIATSAAHVADTSVAVDDSSAAAAKRPVARGSASGSRDILQSKNGLSDSNSSSSSSLYSTSGLQSRVESLKEGLTSTIESVVSDAVSLQLQHAKCRDVWTCVFSECFFKKGVIVSTA